MFVILFGLSMDYHVFILSRIPRVVRPWDERQRMRSPHGIKSTAGVVTSAAPRDGRRVLDLRDPPDPRHERSGSGLAAAVMIDATIVRAHPPARDDEAARRVELVSAELARLALRGSITGPARRSARPCPTPPDCARDSTGDPGPPRGGPGRLSRWMPAVSYLGRAGRPALASRRCRPSAGRPSTTGMWLPAGAWCPLPAGSCRSSTKA